MGEKVYHEVPQGKSVAEWALASGARLSTLRAKHSYGLA